MRELEYSSDQVVTEKDAMSNMQKIDKRVLYILVGIDMRPNARFTTVIIALCDHYDSLLAALLSSIKVNRYSRVVKIVQRKG